MDPRASRYQITKLHLLHILGNRTTHIIPCPSTASSKITDSTSFQLPSNHFTIPFPLPSQSQSVTQSKSYKMLTTSKNNKFHPRPTTKIKPYTKLPTLLPRAQTRNIITTRNTALSKSTTHFPISISNKSTIRTKTKQQNQINQTNPYPALASFKMLLLPRRRGGVRQHLSRRHQRTTKKRSITKK